MLDTDCNPCHRCCDDGCRKAKYMKSECFTRSKMKCVPCYLFYNCQSSVIFANFHHKSHFPHLLYKAAVPILHGRRLDTLVAISIHTLIPLIPNVIRVLAESRTNDISHHYIVHDLPIIEYVETAMIVNMNYLTAMLDLQTLLA